MKIYHGVDLIEIERFKKAYEKYGEKFLKKIFFDDEILLSEKKLLKMCISFSFKESIWKSLPEKIQEKLIFKDIKIGWNDNKPYLMKKIKNYKVLLSYSLSDKYVLTVALLIER